MHIKALAEQFSVSASYMVIVNFRMAGELDPTKNECKEYPLSEESEENAAILQQQRQREAYGKGVIEKTPIRHPRYNLRSASPSDRLEASVGCVEEGDPMQLPPTTRTHAQSDSIGQNTVSVARELLPQSSPLVDFDSESRKLNDRLPLERDRVRKRSPDPRLTSGHTSQACDSQNLLPLSSSDTAEEQGGDPECRPKKGGRHVHPKRKRPN